MSTEIRQLHNNNKKGTKEMKLISNRLPIISNDPSTNLEINTTDNENYQVVTSSLGFGRVTYRLNATQLDQLSKILEVDSEVIEIAMKLKKKYIDPSQVIELIESSLPNN